MTAKIKPRLVGYVRVSTLEQDLDMQLDALRAAGCAQADIYRDKVSGLKSSRPGWDQCLGNLREGDTLIVYKLDRVGRSLRHLIDVVDELAKKKVKFKSVRDVEFDTTTHQGKLIFHIFSALAEFERGLIVERTKAGLAAARARGRKGGRKRIEATDPRVKAADALYAEKKLSVPQICATLKISRATFYRYLAAS
jgi:DNA invertase Pin-like site-specific DNA recombinase